MNFNRKRRAVLEDLSNMLQPGTEDVVCLSEVQPRKENTISPQDSLLNPLSLNTSTDDDVVMVGCEFIIRPPAVHSEAESPDVINLCSIPYVPRGRPFKANEVIVIEDSTPPPRKRRHSDTSSTNTTPDPTKCKCSICMDSYLRRNPTSTFCGHVFCEECIMTAIKTSKKCPLCNTKLNNKKVHRVFM